MNEESAKTKYGFTLCEWDNNEQLEPCEKCSCIFDKIYFRKTQYWCMACIKEEEKRLCNQ